MYDRLRLYYPSTRATPDITPFLDRVVEQTDLQTGEVKTFGRLQGLKVGVYAGGISIMGSLAKYMYGNNICSLDRRATATAIGKLSDALHLDMGMSQVTGMEFGTNFVMNKPIPVYLRKLGDTPRLIRTTLTDSVLYYKPRGKSQSKVLCFYDKAKEADVKDVAVPEGLMDANLLRYEIRLKGRVHQQLKVPAVAASTLSDRRFYEGLVRVWQSNYFSISKANRPIKNDMSNIKSVSGAFNALVARLISQSDQSQITAFFDELRDARVFDGKRVYYTRLKQKIKAVMNDACLSVDDDMKELDDAVKNAGAYV